ncbi:hypothetical protein F8M41_005265 [Gigaspora margarita]|uniref:Uncharacterized protein n=1 Tax=Gigaspora margarita TaxID=4874 RepID=A0A8H4B4H5_GIGMA|nr:hypothetical protein F8M41_005265 [Gigaspora margarita]
MSYIDTKINNIVIIICEENHNFGGNIRFERAIRGTALCPIFKYFICDNNSTTNNNTSSPNNLKLEKRNGIVVKATSGDSVILENKEINRRHLCSLALIGKMIYHHDQIDLGLIIKKNKIIDPEPIIRDSINTNLFIEDLIEVSSNGIHFGHSGVNSYVECEYVEVLNRFVVQGALGIVADLVVSSVISFEYDSEVFAFFYKQD